MKLNEVFFSIVPAARTIRHSYWNYGTFLGTLVPRSKSDVELSLPWNFRFLELSPPNKNYFYLHDQLLVFPRKAYYFFLGLLCNESL